MNKKAISSYTALHQEPEMIIRQSKLELVGVNVNNGQYHLGIIQPKYLYFDLFVFCIFRSLDGDAQELALQQVKNRGILRTVIPLEKWRKFYLTATLGKLVK
jgi:hypothetical protein